jgi:four helix bundle protein
MGMTPEQFKARTKQFGLRVIRLVDALPTRRRSARVIGDQLLRSATSVGANYRAACRARSQAEFCAKLGIVEEEADESVYWLEMLGDAEIVRPGLLEALIREGNEILAMVVASVTTSRGKRAKSRS